MVAGVNTGTDRTGLVAQMPDRRWTVTIAYRCSVPAVDETEAVERARAVFTENPEGHEWNIKVHPGASAWIPGEPYTQQTGDGHVSQG